MKFVTLILTDADAEAVERAFQHNAPLFIGDRRDALLVDNIGEITVSSIFVDDVRDAD